MTGILKVDQWKDSGDNALMTSDGAGNLNCNVNLGIGTTSPDGKLHIGGISGSVSGIVLETTAASGDTNSIDFHNLNGDLRMGIEYDASTADLNIVKRDRTKIVTFDESTGNMGIGTTSPTDLLDVRGSIKARDASDNVGRFHTRNAFTVTNGTAIQLTSVCGSAIVCVSCNTTGSGGLFWGTFSTTVSKLAGDGLTSDSGTSDIAVYKSSSSNLMYFKNRSGFSRDYVITVYAARHA